MTTTSTRMRQIRQPEPHAAKRGHSRVAEIVHGIWAITPSMLTEIQTVYATHMRGEKIDISAVEAKLGRPLANDQQRGYELQSGVAILAVDGVLAPKMNFFMEISGGSSTQMLAQYVAEAADDPGVRSILLVIDSPGGSVLGTPEFAQAVRAAADVKPVVALCEGIMASAAYWVGAAANAIYATGPTVMVGSIGVLSTHIDKSAADAKNGIKRTEIVAGKYKRIDSDTAALSDEGAEYKQGHVDAIYEVFVDTVADFRGVSSDDVLEHMADGRVFIGQQAIDAGLVDGASTRDALIAQMAATPEAFASRRTAKIAALSGQSKGARAGAARPAPVTASADGASLEASTEANTTGEISHMDPKDITAEVIRREHPAIAAEFAAAGATAELERAKGVRATLIPGHEALVEALASDGKTTPGEAALAVLAAERGNRAADAKAHAHDAPGAAAATPKAGVEKATDRSTIAAEARAYSAEHKVPYLEAIKKLNPELC